MIALVTGGASGIGRETACALAAIGYQVGVADIDGDGAAATAAAIRSAGHAAISLTVDVTNETEVEAGFAALETAFGTITALVACAGVTIGIPAIEMTQAAWRRIIDINLTGTFLCCQAAARRMVPARAGSIVTLASVTGLAGVTTRAAYAASKGGIIALTQTLAVEFGVHGVRVNCIAPGAIATPLAAQHHAGAGAAIGQRYIGRTPLGRYGTAAEIASVAAFLVSPAASYVNGEVIAADGGYLATGMML